MDSRWETGHFLGIQDEPAELIVGTSIGVLKVRSVRSYTSIADQWGSINRFEVAGVPIEVAKEALRLAAQKLPVKTKFIIARDFEA